MLHFVAIPSLPAPLNLPWWRPLAGWAIFACSATLIAAHLAVDQGRPWAFVALTAIPVGAAFVARRPVVTAIAIAAGALILQVSYVGIGYSDQIDLGRAAWSSVLAGETPYRVHDLGTHTNPFAYGPLSMVTAQFGPPLELASSAGIFGLLVWSRSWLTLGVVAAFPPYIFLAMTGINDFTPGLLILAGVMLLRSRPRLGMVALATAAAVKPYAAAWFLPAVGFAGVGAAVVLVATSAVLWSPLLAWGPGSFIESVRTVAQAGPAEGGINTIRAPLVRLAAIPLALAGLLAHRWQLAVLLGSATFVAVLFFGAWASLGYWIAVLPVTGLALEWRPSSSGTDAD